MPIVVKRAAAPCVAAIELPAALQENGSAVPSFFDHAVDATKYGVWRPLHQLGVCRSDTPAVSCRTSSKAQLKERLCFAFGCGGGGDGGGGCAAAAAITYSANCARDSSSVGVQPNQEAQPATSLIS